MARKTSDTTSTTAPATNAPEQTTSEQTPVAAPVAAKAEPKPLPTLAEALATAKAANPERYEHVLSVVSLTKDGRPARVVIACSNPQTKQGTDGNPVSVCETTREIATQDLFQVRCCAACAERIVRKARRERTKGKIRALKAAVAAQTATA